MAILTMSERAKNLLRILSVHLLLISSNFLGKTEYGVHRSGSAAGGCAVAEKRSIGVNQCDFEEDDLDGFLNFYFMHIY